LHTAVQSVKIDRKICPGVRKSGGDSKSAAPADMKRKLDSVC